MISKASMLFVVATITMVQSSALAAKTCESIFSVETLEITPIHAAKTPSGTEGMEVLLSEAQVKFIASSHKLFVGKFPPRLEVLTKAELRVIARQVEKSGGGRMVELLPEEIDLLEASQVNSNPRELMQMMGITKKGRKILSGEFEVQGRTQEELVAESQDFIARHKLAEVIILLTHPLFETKLANETALISPLKLNELMAAQKLSALEQTVSVRIRAALPAGHAYEASFGNGERTAP